MQISCFHNRILPCFLLLWFAIAGTPAIASCHQEKTHNVTSCCEMEKQACSCKPQANSNLKTGDLGALSSCPCNLNSAPVHPYQAIELPRFHVEFAALDTLPVVFFLEATDAPLTVDQRVTTLRSFVSSSSSPRAPPFKG